MIERVQVRDLEQGLKLLDEVKEKDSQVQGLIAKAERWLGKLEIKKEFDYTTLQLIPLTVLREERSRSRALIRAMKKETKINDLSQVLDHMYRLAILHDAASFVMLNTEHSFNTKEAKNWDSKLNKLAREIQKYSYAFNGRIKESNNCYLTENDYKTFQKVYPDVLAILDPVSLIK